jgi:hypothetical protein
MSDIDNKIIVDKDEYMELLKNNYYLNGRIAELEKQVNMLVDMLNQK